MLNKFDLFRLLGLIVIARLVYMHLSGYAAITGPTSTVHYGPGSRLNRKWGIGIFPPQSPFSAGMVIIEKIFVDYFYFLWPSQLTDCN